MHLSIADVAVDEACEECLTLVARTAADKGLRIETNFAATPVIKTDRTRLKQVVLNLLSNAIKYNYERGSVILATTVGDRDGDADTVRISVTDSGPGIDQAHEGGLFEPFNRLGQETGPIEGTGIGLTITKQLVEAMQGQIGYETEVGKGSTFWVEFPSSADAVPQNSAPADTHLAPPKAATALYIDHNMANIRLMEAIFAELEGVELVAAQNAAAACDAAETRRPDLILIDFDTLAPAGNAALDVIRENPATRDIPIIIAALAGEDHKAMASEVSAVINKPVDVQELVSVIKDHVDRKDVG